MAKSLRSKIKRKFRTELRKRIGVPHQQEMEAKIQDNLKKALQAQAGGKSVFELKKLMGSAAAPVAAVGVSTDASDAPARELSDKEAELLNAEAEAASKKAAKEKKKADRKKAAENRRKKKFVHFHTLRKKGV